MHGEVSKNICQAQVEQKWAYVSRKCKQLFLGFMERETFVKMKKSSKKKLFASSWELVLFHL